MLCHSVLTSWRTVYDIAGHDGHRAHPVGTDPGLPVEARQWPEGAVEPTARPRLRELRGLEQEG